MDGTSGCHICYVCRSGKTCDCSQIFIPMENPIHIWIGAEDYEISVKQLCFLPAGMAYQCDIHGAVLVIQMPKEDRPNDTLCVMDHDEQAELLVQLIQKELRQNPNSTAVWHLYDYLCDRQNTNGISYKSAKSAQQQQNKQAQMSGKAAKISDTHTYSREKQQAKTSNDLYLRDMRIARAKDMLRSTQYSMMEIAETVGYSGNATFTRAFRNAEGMTPTQYRLRTRESRQMITQPKRRNILLNR